MKFFSTSQIRDLDRFTIDNEPVSSFDLMERAADALYWKYTGLFSYRDPVLVLAGPGNNGGDALALARKLLFAGYEVSVCLMHTGDLSADCNENRILLAESFPDSFIEYTDRFVAPVISKKHIVVDGLFGSGLNRRLTGIYAAAVEWINSCQVRVVAIDIPSGLYGEDEGKDTKHVVKANYTFTLQFPKVAFFWEENEIFVGKWEVVGIGIHPQAIEATPTNFYYLTKNDIRQLLKTRARFSHKGTYGHVLLVAGSKGMAGSSVLAARACLRSGVGLITVHGPESNRMIVQSAIPEAIFSSDLQDDAVSLVPDTEKYDVLAIGPGTGVSENTAKCLEKILDSTQHPVILDADALNIIGKNKELLNKLPANSVLTPHPREFERIFGPTTSSYERMVLAKQSAQYFNIYIVLKDAYTLIATPDGKLIFNTTGHPGMATAGSGDVLTGIIAALVAQGYSPEDAALTGVFLHGKAAELALKKESEESMISGDIIRFLGSAFKLLKDNQTE